jgi:hypothetical protein
MDILVVHNTQNTHGNDASGAFIPEAVNFKKYRATLGDRVTLVGFDNLLPKAARTAAFLRIVAEAAPFHAFVYLGHGLRNSLSSANIAGPNRTKLAKLLATKAIDKSRLYVTLYACSTGETTTKQADGEGGFADRLRDDLVDLGITGGWVDGHTCAAHATQNPYLRRFAIDAAEKDGGGDWVVDPKSAEWPRWRERLNAKWRDDPFRFVMPYMPIPAIRDACRKEV